MDSTKTGKLIAELRRGKGITQSELATELSVSDKAVSKWECGRGCPDISIITELAKFFGISADALLEGELNTASGNGGNMKKTKFYRCPECGNIIFTESSADVNCCSRKLEPMTAKAADEEHRLNMEKIDGENYVTFSHPMQKEHYICFAAYINYDRMCYIRLYPEQGAEFRLPELHGGKLFYCCSKDGLFYM